MKLNIQLFAITKTTTFTEPALTEQNIIDNNSSVSIAIKFSAGNSVTYFSNKTLSCTCNGVTQTAKVSLSKGGSVSKTFTFNNIAHNDDGTKSVNWSWNCNTGTSVLGNISSSGTKQLQTIPRASDITSVSNGTTTYNPVVKWTPKNNTFKFKVKYSFGSWSYTSGIISPATTSETQYNGYTIPHSIFTNAPNSTTATVTAALYTYQSDGTTLVGEKTKVFTVTLNSSIKPSVSIGTISEASGVIPSGWNVFVQNKSRISVPITANGIQGSTISSIISTTNNNTYSGNSFTTSVLTTSGNNTINTTAKDSRGRTQTATKTYNVVAYTNPSITTATAVRCLQNGTESDEGTYLKYSFVASISSVSNKNSKLFRIGYKSTSSSSYTYVTIDNSNYSINKTNQILSGVTFDTNTTYDIVFEAVDSFTTSRISKQIESGFDLMNFNASGKAMAIGKVSEAGSNEELLEIGTPTKAYENMNIIKSSGDTFLEVKNTTNNSAIDFMVSSYGTKGVYDRSLAKWMFWGTNWNVYFKGISDYQKMFLCNGNENTPNAYTKLCNIKYERHHQGSFTSIRIYIGDGQNGRTNQNAFIDLTMQLGWINNNNGRFGCTWELHPMKTDFNLNNVNIIVIANSNIDYDVYLWTSKLFCRVNYTVELSEMCIATHIGTISTTAPSGTRCECGGILVGNYYSTSETLIGTWLNGKPLYRKVITFTTTNSAYTYSTVRHNISNVETIFIDFSHSEIVGSDGNRYFLNSVRPASDTSLYTHGSHNWFRINGNNSDIDYVVGSILTNRQAVLVLEYTKTTD